VSGRREERNEALRSERRAEILDRSLALFSERGYSETTVRMIAEAVGMSQGLLYRYFPSKDDLLLALFEQSMRDVRASFASADTGTTPDEKIEQLIRSAFAIVQANLRFWKLSYGVRMQTAVLAGLGEALRGWTATIRQTLEAYLSEAGVADPATEARILFALIDGACQHYVLEPETYPLDQIADVIVARYKRPNRERSEHGQASNPGA
jgi:AcrR family transcriptional regulator